jgi:hypothetical protein
MFIARWVAFPALTATDCLILGLVGAVLGPLGDLCESLLKRAHGSRTRARSFPAMEGCSIGWMPSCSMRQRCTCYVVAVRALLGGSAPGAL